MAGRFAPRPRTAPGAPPRAASRSADATRQWAPPAGPYDLGLVLGPLRRGPGDPTFRALPDGAVRRACRTPDGPCALRLTPRDGVVEAEAWGPGAGWLLERLPELLGAADDPDAFVPRHRPLVGPGAAVPDCGCAGPGWCWSR